MSHAHVTHLFVCFYGYVPWLITADVSGSKLPFNLPIYTCLLLSRAWNTNITNANANQRLTKTSAGLLWWVKDKSTCLPLRRTDFTHRLPPAPRLLLTATIALRPCCQHLTEKSLSTRSFCCFSRWFNMCLLEWNHRWIWLMGTPPYYRCWAEVFFTMCALFIDETLPYHVYLLVPLLCSGEADDFSRFSLLSCFHGLLDRSTMEEAEVRAELMRWINSEAPARRQKSGTFVLVCVTHLKLNKTELERKKKKKKPTENKILGHLKWQSLHSLCMKCSLPAAS